ncbi:MAG: metal-sensing transcriptional repressor [Alphaproteobacteria bacterium]|nr:metal-sensing transcriptional repressor [Alphaproteobacteria bacterium]
MVENDRYNVDILTQIRASRAALKSLESKMIEDILRDLINNNNTSSIDKNNNFDELLKMIRKIDIL